MQSTCPLCFSHDCEPFFSDKLRDYLQCGVCRLVFVLPHFFLSVQAEKSEYDLHQNSPQDAGYRKFLSRLYDPMQEMLHPNSVGLDFGCGPGPTLSLMFEQAGHHVNVYDKFYADDPPVLHQPYDFITATEVVEHLHHPGKILDHLWSLLKPGGFLGIMTKLVIDKNAFAAWHYKNDRTHVCFFSRETFFWLAKKWQSGVEFVEKDVVIFSNERHMHAES